MKNAFSVLVIIQKDYQINLKHLYLYIYIYKDNILTIAIIDRSIFKPQPIN